MHWRNRKTAMHDAELLEDARCSRVISGCAVHHVAAGTGTRRAPYKTGSPFSSSFGVKLFQEGLRSLFFFPLPAKITGSTAVARHKFTPSPGHARRGGVEPTSTMA